MAEDEEEVEDWLRSDAFDRALVKEGEVIRKERTLAREQMADGEREGGEREGGSCHSLVTTRALARRRFSCVCWRE